MDLKRHVKRYRQRNAARHRAELDYFCRPDLQETVEAAVLAIGPSRTMLSHQRRVGGKVLNKAKKALLGVLDDIKSCKSFDQLHNLITDATRNVRRFGTLARYDTALRIGVKLQRLPVTVYLHAGTQVGARKLRLDTRRGKLRMDELPKALRKLKPHEVEDFLCVFHKKNFWTQPKGGTGCGNGNNGNRSGTC